MNIRLQGDDLNLIKTKSVISAFISKLQLHKRNFGRGEFYQFPNLASVEKTEEDILIYYEHLETLNVDFQTRFQDIINMKIPDWVLDPFSNSEQLQSGLPLQFQEELIELTTNEELKFKFVRNGYQDFWLQKEIPSVFPGLWTLAKSFFIAFPSSYLVERGFSAVTTLLSKKRSNLQVVERGDLRLLLTKIEPNIEKLLLTHQAQASH